MPSVLWCCWLGGRKGIRPVKHWVVRCWHGYLSGARCRLHMAQLMPPPLTVSCFSKIQIGFTFLVPAHLGGPGHRAVKRVNGCCSGRLESLCGSWWSWVSSRMQMLTRFSRWPTYMLRVAIMFGCIGRLESPCGSWWPWVSSRMQMLTRSRWWPAYMLRVDIMCGCSGRLESPCGSWWRWVSSRMQMLTRLRWWPTYCMATGCASRNTVPMNCKPHLLQISTFV